MEISKASGYAHSCKNSCHPFGGVDLPVCHRLSGMAGFSIRYGGGVAYPKYFGFAYCLKNNASKINLFHYRIERGSITSLFSLFFFQILYLHTKLQ